MVLAFHIGSQKSNNRPSSMLGHPAGCDKISWGQPGKYPAMAYDRQSKRWTDKGRSRCESQQSWQGVGIGRAECQKMCEGDGTCEGVFGSLDDKSDGGCWTCGFDADHYGKLISVFCCCCFRRALIVCCCLVSSIIFWLLGWSVGWFPMRPSAHSLTHARTYART